MNHPTNYNVEALKRDLTRDEGRKRLPYTDTVGKLTIGVGWNLTDNGLPDSVIDALLALSIQQAEAVLDRVVTNWRNLDEVRQRVLLNMAFNMGYSLAEFRQMLRALSARDYKRAADCMRDSLWAKQVGKRAQRLAVMMETGISM